MIRLAVSALARLRSTLDSVRVLLPVHCFRERNWYVTEKAAKANAFMSIATLIDTSDGKCGKTPSDGPTTRMENGRITSCKTNRNNAQFHGHNGVNAIGRQAGPRSS